MTLAPTLTPEQSAWLADTIARNRAQFAGWTMEGDPATDPASDPDPAEPNPGNPPADPPADPAEPDNRPERQAARYRTERNALQQQLQEAQQAQADMLANIAKALGLAPDESADPAAQVSDLTSQVQTLTTEVDQLRAELMVHNLAGDLSANPSALLDSRAFTNALHALDAGAEDYRDQVVAAIKDAVASNTSLRAAGPRRGGTPSAGGGTPEDGAVTAEQFAGMSYREKVALYNNNPDLYRRLAGS